MSEINIEVAGGSSVRLPTAGKYCDRNIVVTATGGGDFSEIESKMSNGFTDYSNYFYMKRTMTYAPEEILQHTSSGTNFNSTFYYCEALIAVPSMETPKGTNFNSMFAYCSSLVYIPPLDTAKGNYFHNIFSYCTKLVTVGGVDFSKAIGFDNAFKNCTALENITINGVINRTGLSFSDCTKLTHDSLMSAINALYDYVANGGTGTYTLTLGSTNLAKLTDAEKAIATQKGWTLA